MFNPRFLRHGGDGRANPLAAKDGDNNSEIEIPTNGFQVTVKKNECLTTEDVKRLFQVFLTGGDRPTNFSWRDVTDRFV